MLVVVLLGVVVTGDPVRLVVARHSELGELALDDVEVTILAAGELIAEAEPVIEEAEADSYGIAIALLLERDEQFVVVVADRLDLAPDRLPGLIEVDSFVSVTSRPLSKDFFASVISRPR